ncbi:hypothetical protein ACLUWI_02140 [Limosilactobacillus mucosae]
MVRPFAGQNIFPKHKNVFFQSGVGWLVRLTLFNSPDVIFGIIIIRKITFKERHGSMLKTISKMQMVEERLRQEYGNDLFQRKNINAAEYGTTDAEMTTILNRLRQQDKLADFGVSGLYQFVKWNNDLGFPIEDTAGLNEIIDYLYLSNNSGYIYGADLLEWLELSNQIARVITLTTNNVKRKVTKRICNVGVEIKPGLTKITKENQKFLAALDTVLAPGMLATDNFSSSEIIDKLAAYALSDGISLNEIKRIVLLLPPKQIRKIIKEGYYDSLLIRKRGV